MAFVDMKCPNCGAPLGKEGERRDRFECPYCHSVVLNIIDAKINADVETIDAKTFAKKLEESRKMFLIKTDDGIEVFDSHTAIINKRIKDAKVWLEAGNFGEASSMLAGLPDNIPSVLRMRLLIHNKVRNEFELMRVKGNIRGSLFERFISVCGNDETITAYQKIADICELAGNMSTEIRQRKEEVKALASNGLHREAVMCAYKVCRDYPQTAESWAVMCYIKCYLSSDYNCRREVSIMRCCPDYDQQLLPESVRNRIDEFYKCGTEYIKSVKSFCLFLICTCAIIALGTSMFYMAEVLLADAESYRQSTTIVIGFVGGLATIIFICMSIYNCVCFLRIYSKYRKILSAIPITEVTLFHASKFIIPSLTFAAALIIVAVHFVLGIIGELS